MTENVFLEVSSKRNFFQYGHMAMLLKSLTCNKIIFGRRTIIYIHDQKKGRMKFPLTAKSITLAMLAQVRAKVAVRDKCSQDGIR